EAVKNPAYDTAKIAALVQGRCQILSDIPERIDFFDELPEYSPELYVHKKMKTNFENSLESLGWAKEKLSALEDWSNEGLQAALVELAAEKGVKNGLVMWPVRVAVSGKPATPGGATELCEILGKEESLRRIDAGIELLSKVNG
ncbi:MAG: glutamate--tRNA ligase, partial [Oscillospiraceae bacterium]|nr:glutamate--tRNA ligase [Oscillospiraceae bacterium]